MRLPNIVALVGEEKAEAFLRNALTNYNVTLAIEDSNATAALARKIALQVVDQLKAPQWALVNSLDSLELFEALDKKFTKPAKPAAPAIRGVPDGLDFMPENGSGDYARAQAETYYLLGLIGASRPKDAVVVAERLARSGRVYLPHEALAAMERAGFVKALDDFFFELLTKDSSLPYWNEYVQLAAKAGSTERMMKLARAAASDENVPKAKRASIHQNLFRALLADGQVDEGAAELKRLLAIDSPTSRMEMGRGSLGLMLAKLGVLLKRPEWTEEGIRAARASLTNSQENVSNWMDESVSSSLAHLLLDLKRGAEAEGVLIEALTDAVRKLEARAENSYGEDSKAGNLLASLASLYHGVNRPRDVVALLDNAPYWGAQDLADLFENGIGMEMSGAYFAMRMQVHSAEKSYPLSYVVAVSLATLGRNAEARAVNQALLAAQPGYDRAYELALKLDGENAVAHMDELFSRDQFEERPLIWKARLLAEKKDFAAAEEVVRRAIAIDPSDGEQGPGDRMRAYAVLADIREARGDQKDAAFFRGVVKAIRLSEEADQFYGAGLLRRAVAMYEESLKSFADAYCIQSRLAIQLAELGLHDQAEEHYRRAYELMPDSFGRVESHCFGCEKAFAGARAQTLAEKIFTELAAKNPNKPQVHYLLGYLRGEQERHADAVPHFRKAVQLDPEYLNAWQKLLGVSSHVRMPASERDQIVFNLLRLDPLRRHISVGWQHVSDLKGLWAALDAANKKQPQKPQSLYPLAASKARLEKNDTAQGRRFGRMQFSRMYRNANQSPGAALAQTPYLQAAQQLLDYVNYEEQ
jgi:tetratricopeptide (TPR) repeat protein